MERSRPDMDEPEFNFRREAPEGTVESWQRKGLLRTVSLPTKVERFRREDMGQLRREMWDDVIIEELRATLSKEEARTLFDRHAQEELGISGDEFMRRRETGEYDGQDTPEVNRMEMLIPLWSPETE